MKCTAVLLVFVLACVLPLAALADDAGVLSEMELTQWVQQVLLDSRLAPPMNAPVAEDALTEDGYAHLYQHATLFYDSLQQDAVLRGITVTDERYFGPRGIRLGSEASVLLETFGWQNPQLQGDGLFAAFYALDELPEAGYWSWAQLDENGAPAAVQCAIHTRTENGYSDILVSFAISDGVVESISVRGLGEEIPPEAVIGNLDAVHALLP